MNMGWCYFDGKEQGKFAITGINLSRPIPQKTLFEKQGTKKGFAVMQILCGERGIRTLDTVTRILPFQGSSFNHSDTSPDAFSGENFS